MVLTTPLRQGKLFCETTPPDLPCQDDMSTTRTVAFRARMRPHHDAEDSPPICQVRHSFYEDTFIYDVVQKDH